MIKRNFIYSIEGLPPISDDDGFIMPGGFGFNINLKAEFAKRAHSKELPKENHFRYIAKSIIEGTGLSKDPYHINGAFRFTENDNDHKTCLLRYIQVPGDACDIGIDGSEYSNILRTDWSNIERNGALMYDPHNIDTHSQAYALLALFTSWANITDAYLKD